MFLVEAFNDEIAGHLSSQCLSADEYKCRQLVGAGLSYSDLVDISRHAECLQVCSLGDGRLVLVVLGRCMLCRIPGQIFPFRVTMFPRDICFVFSRMYSELISSSIAEGGPYASRTSFVKLLRYGNIIVAPTYQNFVKRDLFLAGTKVNYDYTSPVSRSVKRETLKLIETFVDKAEDVELISKQFVPAMMDPILGDYARNVSDARESEVLSLFATIINK